MFAAANPSRSTADEFDWRPRNTRIDANSSENFRSAFAVATGLQLCTSLLSFFA